MSTVSVSAAEVIEATVTRAIDQHGLVLSLVDDAGDRHDYVIAGPMIPGLAKAFAGGVALAYRCTVECRDEHCVTPIACEEARLCPPTSLFPSQP